MCFVFFQGYTNKKSEHHRAENFKVLISVTVFRTSALIEPPPDSGKLPSISKRKTKRKWHKYKRKTEDCWEEIFPYLSWKVVQNVQGGYFEIILDLKVPFDKIFLKGIKLIY